MQDRTNKKSYERRSFQEEIRRNRLRLRWALVMYFVLALLAGNATGKAFQFVADPDGYYANRYGVFLDGETGPDTSPFSYVNQVTFAVLLLAWVNYRRMYRRGDSIVLSLVDAQPLKDQQFSNIGEEVAIAAGISAPQMWVIESPGLNAFACSRADGQASIALTRGLLEQFSREQIQAVVGHEMAHIRNGDAQLMTAMLGMGRTFHLVSAFALGPLRALFDAGRLANDAESQPGDGDTVDNKESALASIWERPATVPGVLFAALAMPFVALILLVVGVVVSLTLVFAFGVLMLLFPWLVAGYAVWEILRDYVPAIEQWLRRRSSGQRTWWGELLVFVPAGLMVGSAILVLGILVPTMLLLMRLGVTRNREFQADASAVELTRNPGALRTALEKIRNARDADPAGSQLPEALSPLMIVPARRRWVSTCGLDWLNELLSTHPPLEKRILKLAEMEG